MLTIIRHQMLDGFQSAMYLFLSVLIILSFLINGFVCSENYKQEMSDYQFSELSNLRELETTCSSLQSLAIHDQKLMQPPSPLTFIADGGRKMLPNVVVLNAFSRYEYLHQHRGNEEMPILPALDWEFIIGILMTLLTILLSYGAFSSEKEGGTLGLVLSNPVSRLKLFFGKFTGLIIVLTVTLLVGILVNLLTISLSGGPPLGLNIAIAIGWIVIASALLVSVFVMLGLAVSALTVHPPVSLVVLLVLWVLIVAAVPGMGLILAETASNVPSRDTVEAEQARVEEEIIANAPKVFGMWRGNPFDEHIPIRARVFTRIAREKEKIRDSATDAQVLQAFLVQVYSSPSPSSLFSDALEMICGTGIYGFEQLMEKAENYRRQLHSFVVERDRLDPETPHIVYSTSRSHFDRGVFSSREIPLSAIPRFKNLWSDFGLSLTNSWPAWQLLLLLIYCALIGMVAFVALAHYDPR